MRQPRTRKFLAIPALLLLAIGAVVAGQTPATARSLATVQDEDRAYTAPGNGVAACDGGAQIASLVRMNDSPTTITQPANQPANPVLLPGAVVPFAVPQGNSAQVVVTFDAEARLVGQPLTYAVPADFLRVQILLDGAPMPPDNDLMFTTDVGQSNATQACRRVGPGNHTVTVVWQLVDQAAANGLTGILDDWQVTVQLSA